MNETQVEGKELQVQARDLIFGAIERLLAACESDADLGKLPPLRDFIEREVRNIDEWLKPLVPHDSQDIIGLIPSMWPPTPEQEEPK